MEHEIFISYSRKDFDTVKAVKNQIDKEVCINCWMDLEIKSGEDNFKKVIINAIKESDTMLFMMSSASMESEYALKEIDFAKGEQKRIILVRIDNSPMTDDFRFDYSAKDIIDWNNPIQREKLIANLQEWFPNETLLQKKREEEELRKKEEERKKQEELQKKQEEDRLKKQEAKTLAIVKKKKAEEEERKRQQKKAELIEKLKEKLFIGLITVVVLGIAILANRSCRSSDNSAGKLKLESQIDTLSYAIGMTQTEGITKYLSETLNIDTALMDYFVFGFLENKMPSGEEQKKAYLSGSTIRMQVDNKTIPGVNHELFVNDTTLSISPNLFYAGFVDGIQKNYHIMDKESARQTANQLMTSIRDWQLGKQFSDNKKRGEDFLVKNAANDGGVTLPEGTQYKVLKEGTGSIPKDTSIVTVNYEGRTIDGVVFDSSYKRNEPMSFRCNHVIKGWQDVLVRMPVGSVWEVYVPQERAYGNRQQGSIKPYSVLIFKIELLKTQ